MRKRIRQSYNVVEEIEPDHPPTLPTKIIAWWERPYGYWHFEQVRPGAFEEEIDDHIKQGRHVRVISIASTKRKPRK